MGLVGYSDSEASESEEVQAPQPKAPTATGKLPIQKLVDKSSGKIRVNLGSLSSARSEVEDERPAKKARIGGGGSGLLGELNSFLPAPKRAATIGIKEQGNGEKKALGKGRPLGFGVSLKTGAAPAFSRELPQSGDYNDSGDVEERRETRPVQVEDVKIIGKATVFRPLSVANKKKKKPIASAGSLQAAQSKQTVPKPPVTDTSDSTPKPKPKVSLFSISQDATEPPPEPSLEPQYPTPIPSSAEFDLPEPAADDFLHDSNATGSIEGQSLSDLASTLNLPESARRQLLGRHASKDAPINLLSFITDREYAANEELRAKGEAVQHNPVRGIQPGRHNLRQLVSSAVLQKEALEEKWAEGKAKPGAAGNRYGWR
jgi:hypothetical protein